MRSEARSNLIAAAGVGLDMSPGDPDVSEALIYIEALEALESVGRKILEQTAKGEPIDMVTRIRLEVALSRIKKLREYQ